MNHYLRIIFFFGLLFALLLTADAVWAEVKVTDTGYMEFKIGGEMCVVRDITVDTGRRIFTFRCNGASVGMPLPVQMNWKMNELCTVWVNGERYFEYSGKALKKGFEEKTKLSVTANAAEVRLEAVQNGAQAKVTLLMTLREGDDKVLLAVKVDPYHPLKQTRIVMECFPSTDEPKNKLTRAIATLRQTQVLRPGQKAFTVKLGQDERWIFLHDAVFDLGTPVNDTRKAGGGCALFYNPAEVMTAEVCMSYYHSDVCFTYGPEIKEMHLLIYDFSFEKSNQDALEYLKMLDLKGVSTNAPAGGL
jgi:hypothetical protein